VQELDVIIRVAGVCVLLSAAALLLRDGRRKQLSWLFLLFALGISGFLAGNTPDPALRLGGAPGAMTHMLSGVAAVFVWWFGLAIFDDDFRPGARELAVGGAWGLLAAADRGVFGRQAAEAGLSSLLVLFGLGLVGHLIFCLLHDREGDLVKARKGARIIVASAITALLLIDLVVDIVFGFAWKPYGFTLVQNAAILVFAIGFAGLVLRADAGALTFQGRLNASPDTQRSAFAKGVVETARETKEESRLLGALKQLMDGEKVFLDPTLNFGKFAQQMGAPEPDVRRLVNHALGHRHFRSFLNVYRVAEARRRLADPSLEGEKIAAIAHDCGFASLASFNRAFKSIEDEAPRDFRERALATSNRRDASAGPNPTYNAPNTSKPTIEE